MRRSLDGSKPISLRRLVSSIREDTDTDISACKILIISDVLQEQGIADVEHFPGMLIRINLKPFSGKINLDNSELLGRIKAKHA